MPLLVLLLVASTAGLAAWLIARRYPTRPAASATVDAARTVGEAAQSHQGLRAVLQPRLDPESATGLLLTLALLFTAGAGVLFGVLAVLVRSNSHLTGIDGSVANWGNRYASAWSTHGLKAVTQAGSISVVVVLCIVLAIAEMHRKPNRWIVPFLIAVVAGEEVVANTIKPIVDRVRPALNPAAATLGPSFPSGHTTTAAAFYAAAALLLGRGRPHAVRAALAGAAVGIAVAVAASRVLLDVHWLTDVIAGLALGWAWFAICGVAFGGRVLSFGAAVEAAAEGADPAVDSVPRRETASVRKRHRLSAPERPK